MSILDLGLEFSSLRTIAKPKTQTLWIIRLNKAPPERDPIWSYYYTDFSASEKAFLAMIKPNMLLLYCYVMDETLQECRFSYSSFMSNFKDSDLEIQIRQAAESDIKLLSEKRDQITVPWIQKWLK